MAKSSEIDDINLNDPELAAAAVKIQASFRGHITRKTVMKNEDVVLCKAAQKFLFCSPAATWLPLYTAFLLFPFISAQFSISLFLPLHFCDIFVDAYFCKQTAYS